MPDQWYQSAELTDSHTEMVLRSVLFDACFMHCYEEL